MTPKILSPNVLSLVGEIGNVIHKTIKVVNIVTSKRSLTVSPGIFIIDIHPTHPIPYSDIYVLDLALHHRSDVLHSKDRF